MHVKASGLSSVNSHGRYCTQHVLEGDIDRLWLGHVSVSVCVLACGGGAERLVSINSTQEAEWPLASPS